MSADWGAFSSNTGRRLDSQRHWCFTCTLVWTTNAVLPPLRHWVDTMTSCWLPFPSNQYTRVYTPSSAYHYPTPHSLTPRPSLGTPIAVLRIVAVCLMMSLTSQNVWMIGSELVYSRVQWWIYNTYNLIQGYFLSNYHLIGLGPGNTLFSCHIASGYITLCYIIIIISLFSLLF